MRMNVCNVRVLLLNDKVVYTNFFGVLGSHLPKVAHFMTLCALLVVLPTCKRGLALPQRRLAETLVSHVINWAVQATLTFKML